MAFWASAGATVAKLADKVGKIAKQIKRPRSSEAKGVKGTSASRGAKTDLFKQIRNSGDNFKAMLQKLGRPQTQSLNQARNGGGDLQQQLTRQQERLSQRQTRPLTQAPNDTGNIRQQLGQQTRPLNITDATTRANLNARDVLNQARTNLNRPAAPQIPQGDASAVRSVRSGNFPKLHEIAQRLPMKQLYTTYRVADMLSNSAKQGAQAQQRAVSPLHVIESLTP